MRRLVIATTLVGSLIALSCTDQRQEGPTEPPSAAPASKVCPSTDPNGIQQQICALFPPTDLLQSATTLYNNIQTKKRQGRTADAQARAVELVNFTFRQFYANKLAGGSSQGTLNNVVELSCDVFAFVSEPGTTCPISTSDVSTTTDPHSAFQACGPEGCLVLPPDKHSGVSVPAGALPGPAFIKISPIPVTFPPRSGPLQTPKDQYPLFREYELFGFEEFEEEVLVGICQLDEGNGDFEPPPGVWGRLKLAHPHPTIPETIEELDRKAAPFLDCSDLNSSSDEIPQDGGGVELQGRIGAAGRAIGRTLAPVLLSLLPEPAEAAVLGECCLGGSTRKFSPFAAVDPESGLSLFFFSDPDFGDVAFDPGGQTFTEDFILSWQVPIEGSQFITAYPAVQVIDPTPPGDARSDIDITVTLIQLEGSTGTLSGTLTQSTSGGNTAAGPNTAVFDDLIISAPGTYQLRFTAEDLPGDPFVESGIFTVQGQIG